MDILLALIVIVSIGYIIAGTISILRSDTIVGLLVMFILPPIFAFWAFGRGWKVLYAFNKAQAAKKKAEKEAASAV